MEKIIKMKNNGGYTLVELIVVILIMAILATGSIIGFSVIRDSDVESSAKKLMLMLNRAEQEAVIREDGSISMRLYQETDDHYYATIRYYDGTEYTVIYRQEIAGSLLKVSVKEDNGTISSTSYINRTASTDPAVITASEKLFYFKKSTGGLQEYYTDIYIEGSKTVDIVVIRETGRSFIR